MKSDDLFEAFSYIDDDVLSLATNELFEVKAKKKFSKRFILCAACIALVLITLIGAVPLYIVLTKNDIHITPKDIDLIFENDATNDNFQLLSAKELEYLGYRKLSSSADSAYVFEKAVIKDDEKRAAAEEFLGAIEGAKAWDKASKNEYFLVKDGTQYRLSFDEYKTLYEISNSQCIEEYTSENADEDNLIKCVSSNKEYLKALLDVDGIFDGDGVSSAVLEKGSDRIMLRIWCKENGESLDHIDFEFLVNADGKYDLTKISYEKLSLKKIMKDLVGTQKGKKLLDGGYTFANGFNCSICDRGLAFGDDAECLLVYCQQSLDNNVSDYLVPFYAFSMKVSDELYAVTYVPAIEIPGLYIYFQQKHMQHIKEAHQGGESGESDFVLGSSYAGAYDGERATLEMIDKKSFKLVLANYTYEGRAQLVGKTLVLSVNSKTDQNTSQETAYFTILQFKLKNEDYTFELIREQVFDEKKRLERINMYQSSLLVKVDEYEQGKLIQTTQYIYDELGNKIGENKNTY